MTLTIISCALIGASYLLLIWAHLSEFSEFNHPADAEHTDNALDRIAYKDYQINVPTQFNHHQSLKLTVVMLVMAGSNNL